MADSKAFDVLCGALEENSSLDRLEARGTVRLALKNAGLDAGSLTHEQLRVIFEKRMPDELKARGVEDAGAVVSALTDAIEQHSAASPSKPVVTM